MTKLNRSRGIITNSTLNNQIYQLKTEIENMVIECDKLRKLNAELLAVIGTAIVCIDVIRPICNQNTGLFEIRKNLQSGLANAEKEG